MACIRCNTINKFNHVLQLPKIVILFAMSHENVIHSDRLVHLKNGQKLDPKQSNEIRSFPQSFTNIYSTIYGWDLFCTHAVEKLFPVLCSAICFSGGDVASCRTLTCFLTCFNAIGGCHQAIQGHTKQWPWKLIGIYVESFGIFSCQKKGG